MTKELRPFSQQFTHLFIGLFVLIEVQGKFDEAIAVLKKAAEFMNMSGNKEAAELFQKRIEFLEFQKSKKSQ